MATNETTRETAQAVTEARERLSAAIYKRDQFASYMEYGDPNDKSAEFDLAWLAQRIKYARKDLHIAEINHWNAAKATVSFDSYDDYVDWYETA